MNFIYNIFITLYVAFIKLISVFNHKARLWHQGRRGLLEEIALSIDSDSDYIWFHCASLGEFEQGRPVVERFRKINPEFKIILTFFSPSGYENKKDYKGADLVFYMPVDNLKSAKKFVEYVNPKAAVFIKYEFWYNHLTVLHQNKIPVIFVSSIFRKNQHFFKFYGGWFRDHLRKVTYFFVQNKESQELLHSIGINNSVVSGDTRFDRVFEIALKPKRFSMIEKFIQGSVIFIAGSTWAKDEELLVPFINSNPHGLKFIIVPHEINTDHISRLMQRIKRKSVKYSAQDEEALKNADVLIIDTIGMLSQLYQYATIAYIGGGFGKGIHNILEPAVFGMPIIFGPSYKNFAEAKDLVNLRGAYSVANQKEFNSFISKLMGNYEIIKMMSEITRKYVLLKVGATDKIILYINALLNLKGQKYNVSKNITLN